MCAALAPALLAHVHAEQYPHLAGLTIHSVLHHGYDRKEYEFCLALILDGLESTLFTIERDGFYAGTSAGGDLRRRHVRL